MKIETLNSYHFVKNNSSADPYRDQRELQILRESNSETDNAEPCEEINLSRRRLELKLQDSDVMSHEIFLSTRLGDLEIPHHVIERFRNSDFSNMDHETVVTWLNMIAVQQAEILRRDHAINGENSRLAQEKTYLEDGMIDFAQYVDKFTAEKGQEFGELKRKYEEADYQAMVEIQEEGLDPEKAMLRRAARRLLAVQKDSNDIKVDWITDFDLTLSTVPGAVKEDARTYLEPNVPSSAPAEKDLEENGRIAFAETFSLYWNNFLRASPNLFYEAGRADRIALRPGVNELFTWINQKNWNTTILSANFGWIVKGALENVPDADKARIIAVWANDVRSTMKDKALQYLAAETPESANIFIGDGSSDKPAVDAHDTTAFNFALKGHGFASQLEEAGATYFEYEDMDSVMRTMELVLEECKMLIKREQISVA